MTSQIARLKELEAARALDQRIQAHTATAFPFENLSAQCRQVLRQGGIHVSAAGAIKGLLIHEVDQILDTYAKNYPAGVNFNVVRIGVKQELMQKGFMLPVKA